MENRRKISKTTLENLPMGAIYPVKCATAAELDSAYQSAVYFKNRYPRSDGGVYKIQRSAVNMTVTISVEPVKRLD